MYRATIRDEPRGLPELQSHDIIVVYFINMAKSNKLEARPDSGVKLGNAWIHISQSMQLYEPGFESTKTYTNRVTELNQYLTVHPT